MVHKCMQIFIFCKADRGYSYSTSVLCVCVCLGYVKDITGVYISCVVDTQMTSQRMTKSFHVSFSKRERPPEPTRVTERGQGGLHSLSSFTCTHT